MEKIFIFILIFISTRNLQDSTYFGIKVFLNKNRVKIQDKEKEATCSQKISSDIRIFKSIYCYKRTVQIHEPVKSVIFTTSKKKKPPLSKGGFQIFIPLQKWNAFYFIN